MTEQIIKPAINMIINSREYNYSFVCVSIQPQKCWFLDENQEQLSYLLKNSLQNPDKNDDHGTEQDSTKKHARSSSWMILLRTASVFRKLLTGQSPEICIIL